MPFNHLVVDDFFTESAARDLSAEFPPYDSPSWYFYKNSIENKKALNNWNEFPSKTYKAFTELNSQSTVQLVSALTGLPLYEDKGLNGGGWHIHGVGGNLNPHLDYSIHPKLGLQRKVNIIIYLGEEMKPEYGGHLGLWKHDGQNNQPGELALEIEPKFNRAVIFDTTQNSWHGMSRPLAQPEGVCRKSLAIYYLCEPPKGTDPRGRALFAARENQQGDPEIAALIRARADVELSKTVYQGE
ncbi:hypothetical protein AEAC466_20980 [Asticcacaulis sp. AC466]|nr:hypothetical protein AEAC466_20980 [Asticcacaulis sp. AC466]